MQLLFFAISIIVLLGGHALLWVFLIYFLGITTAAGETITALILGFFFLSSIVSSYLIHRRDNIFSRWYYMISGFWIGLLLNFALAMIVVYLVKLGELIFGFNVPNLILQIFFFGSSFLLSAWGVYNATSPRVTEYTVAIKDLPIAWENKTIVHISDVHLGPVYRERFFGRLIKQIQDLNPAAVFITGDLFDGMEADFSWFDHHLSALKPPQGLYYSLGNHDLYLGFERAIGLLKDSGVTILDNKMKLVDGLQIIGINYSFNHDFELDQAILSQVAYNKNLPSLLMFHDPNDIPLAKNAGIDLQLSGHTHDGQLFPLNFVTKLYYHGYNYGLVTEGDFNLVVSSGTGTWGPPMKTVGHSEIVKIILKKK